MKERAKRLGYWLKPNYLGLIGGLIFFCFALTPSLLPMPPIYEGLATGISFAVGYFFGVTLCWFWRRILRRELPGWFKDIAWTTLLIGLPIILVTYIVWASNWQNDVRELVGIEPLEGYHFFTILSVALVAALLLLLIGRSIAWMSHKLGKLASRWVPSGLGTALGIVATVVVLIFLYDGLITRTFVTVTNNIYRETNGKTKDDAMQPTSPTRSGSEESLVPWDTLGRQGRSFVSGGPGARQLTEFSEESANEPIRVYVGVESADSSEKRAELALDELKRTKAFEREVLVVTTPTGTGWIEPQSADSLEYIWNGDTAMVATQYSYLPSWISFLVDRERAVDAGRTLFNTIYDHWSQLAEDERPKLFAYGLSLGAYGSQSAFSGVEDLQNRTDGALFLGGPSFSQPWDYFVEDRQRGSPEWQPIYQNGQAVRFAAKAADLSKPQGNWQPPRIIYMQHASDPVVWWNVDLILSQPDWLKEPRGPDVTPLMKWYPFVTFAQVTINQFFAVDMPPGHGHNYTDSIVSAWAKLDAPEGWSNQKTTQLQTIINNYPED